MLAMDKDRLPFLVTKDVTIVKKLVLQDQRITVLSNSSYVKLKSVWVNRTDFPWPSQHVWGFCSGYLAFWPVTKRNRYLSPTKLSFECSSITLHFFKNMVTMDEKFRSRTKEVLHTMVNSFSFIKEAKSDTIKWEKMLFFWDCEGLIMTDCLENGQIITSLLIKLWFKLVRKRPRKFGNGVVTACRWPCAQSTTSSSDSRTVQLWNPATPYIFTRLSPLRLFSAP